jgi:hypothetical protein
MRVINRPESNKKNPEPGKTYVGKIVEHKFVSIPTKNGRTSKALKLMIQPKQDDLFKVSAFDWVGEDETGPYIYAESKMETWIKRILNVSDLSTVRIDSLIGKNCLFVVEKSVGKPDPKKPEAPPREFFNVSDILCIPIEDMMASAPASSPAPKAASTPAPAKQESKPPSWADGDLL